MKKGRLIPVSCAAVVAVSLAGCSGSSGFATEKGANTQAPKAETGAETGKEEDGGEKREEAGASKDKKPITYSPLTESMIDSMPAMFKEDTGIDVEYLAMGTGDALKRIQTETDNSQADILWSKTIGTIENKNEYFAGYTTPNEDAFYGECKSIEGDLTRLDTIPSAIVASTDLAGDIKIEGYEGLLNPELKGKVTFADPAASSSSFGHLVNVLYTMSDDNPDSGWDYIKQFCTQLDGKLLGGSSAIYKGVADGEYTVGLTSGQGSARYVGAGAPVKTVYMSEDVIFRDDGVCIIKGCPNRLNAQKFVDWLTSKDVRGFMSNTQYRRTIRRGVGAGDATVPMDQIRVIQDDGTDTVAHKSERLDEFKEPSTE